MKNVLSIGLLLALSACSGFEPPEPIMCMLPKESGIIRDTKEVTETIRHFRGGESIVETTTVLVEVDGLVRVCQVDEHAAQMLVAGTKASLVNAIRKY